MSKSAYSLNNISPGDIDDVLAKIERSFNITFSNQILKDVHTFGGLCDVVAREINLCHTESCTTQHAFYMLRNALAAITGIDKCSVRPQTKLSEICPKENRLQIISAIEEELGFKMNLLEPKRWILATFGALLLISPIIGYFYSWQIGVAGLVCALISLKLAGKLGKEMHVKTIGELANKISRENYLKSRRDATVNKSEIEQKVRELFANDLHLEPVVLTRTARFN